MSEDLKPCPFCGSRTESYTRDIIMEEINTGDEK